jgi:hypothetical protein
MIGGLNNQWRATVRRVAWGRRVEIGLTLSAWGARLWLSHTFGHMVAFTVVGLGAGARLGAGALVCTTRSREWLLDHTRGEMIERWFGKALAHSGIRGFDGGIDVAESRTVPDGVVLTVHIPDGTTMDLLAEGSEALAVTLRARVVRVTGDPAMAGRADITVLYGDPVGDAAVRWPWDDGK